MADNEEHEEYAGEEEEPELEGVDGELGNAADIADAQAELDAMKARLAEMEAEAHKLRDAQSAPEGGAGPSGDAVDREDADARSVYVGQVDYAATPEELQLHFQGCGTVNRVTILSDKFGNPKGYAYIEFLEADAVQNALLLDNSELRGRNIKVLPKRTNLPGYKGGRGRGGRGGRGRFNPFYGGGGYGYVPRGGRGRGRGRGRFYAPY